MEFSKFNGEEFDNWLLRAEYFFEVNGTQKENWVKIAALHLDGKAIQWHQGFIKAKEGTVSWEEYVHAMGSRFGVRAYDDPLANLRNLRQEGSSMVIL